ncbi:ribbon-helix-helix protein [Halanaerobium saccharolyticum]|uniref:Ribbon-helix-helix protein n=1 Tax=Halanaerobium saccharolyticum TaxID=43595 RepID=A0A4R7Z710_9FIRM|nr:ribbon-helix-helix domain-containing protein [Halanaerobium saccharolyticum]RAK08569.1 ribbon-helix-helix protein [Halanaerobium saccharolyticum]TDW07287.1 ribbon-helix-helix protein [Halanaerobium saccharolyticum]TDX60121.1 ribbon-helix-helix protein [Halanaerobium saccharolyticum]
MSEKKERLQFYIDQDANEKLGIISEKLGVSKASLVREGVNKILKEKLPLEKDTAYDLIGLIDEELEDNNIAKDHDQYLYAEKRPEDE